MEPPINSVKRMPWREKQRRSFTGEACKGKAVKFLPLANSYPLIVRQDMVVVFGFEIQLMLGFFLG
jgi:hypothetical protein